MSPPAAQSRPLRRPLAAVLAAIFLALAPQAAADEFDWVDNVSLKSLKFRPDGLLEGAIRIDRLEGDWDDPALAHGTYNLVERLMDCETGFVVETGYVLMDAADQPLARRAGTREEMIERLDELLESSGGEIKDRYTALPCAAASNTAFRRQRAAAAAKEPPLLAERSLAESLEADARMLDKVPLRYDFRALARKPSAPAGAVFDSMRSQYTDWRKLSYAAYTTPASDAQHDAALVEQANATIKSAGVDGVTITRIQGNIVEHTYPKAHFVFDIMRRQGAGQDVLEHARTDCAMKISVPLAVQEVRRGKPGRVVPLKVRRVLQEIAGYYEHDHQLPNSAGAVCTLLSRVRRGPETEGDADVGARGLPLPFGLKRDAMQAHASGAHMLLAIRAAVRDSL